MKIADYKRAAAELAAFTDDCRHYRMMELHLPVFEIVLHGVVDMIRKIKTLQDAMALQELMLKGVRDAGGVGIGDRVLLRVRDEERIIVEGKFNPNIHKAGLPFSEDGLKYTDLP